MLRTLKTVHLQKKPCLLKMCLSWLCRLNRIVINASILVYRNVKSIHLTIDLPTLPWYSVINKDSSINAHRATKNSTYAKLIMKFTTSILRAHSIPDFNKYSKWFIKNPDSPSNRKKKRKRANSITLTTQWFSNPGKGASTILTQARSRAISQSIV